MSWTVAVSFISSILEFLILANLSLLRDPIESTSRAIWVISRKTQVSLFVDVNFGNHRISWVGKDLSEELGLENLSSLLNGQL